MLQVLKRVMIGSPIATADEGHHRLRKTVALPVFASDAMSSTAYATDEILIVLLVQAGVGAVAFDWLVPLAIIVAILLFIVVLSYRQTIHAYPSGGGSYIVSKANLGTTPSLIAGAALLTDYILTVAVSVAAGVLAMQSAFGFENSLRVPLCLGIIVVLTVANLRGVRESGALFAPPTYLYIVMLGVLIVVGLYRVFFRDLGPIPLDTLSEEGRELAEGTAALSLFMLLRAFSSGAVALSGVEAVSNGVPAFRKPEATNAAKTIAVMGLVLGLGFLGISILASHLKPYRGENDPTGIALMAEYVFGGKNVLFWVIQIATLLILVLAANTAYADFPRLSSIIARDGFLPAADGEPRRPARVLQRHRLPRRRRGCLDHRLRSKRDGADPAVRLRSVHRFHAQPGRHGRPPLPRTRAALEVIRRHQRDRSCRRRASSPSSWSCPSSPREPGSRPS